MQCSLFEVQLNIINLEREITIFYKQTNIWHFWQIIFGLYIYAQILNSTSSTSKISFWCFLASWLLDKTSGSLSKIISQKAKAAVIYAKLICEAGVSGRSSSPKDTGGPPVPVCHGRERRPGKELPEAQEPLPPWHHWVCNSDCEPDQLNMGHLTNVTSDGSAYPLVFNLPWQYTWENRM